MKLCASYQV